MNTRNAYTVRTRTAPLGSMRSGGVPYGLGTPAAILASRPETAAPVQTVAMSAQPVCPTLPNQMCKHSLVNRMANARLARCEESVKGRFEAVVPTLQALRAWQYEPDFAERAQAFSQRQLGHRLPDEILERAWVAGLDLKTLYAYCVFGALKASAAQFAEDLKNHVESVQDARNFFLDCGFHAVDISPCADGRLKGLLRYILRLPLSSFAQRKPYAGALFDVETDIRQWALAELRRYREGVPTTAESGTRYLKIAVYHTSSSNPSHEGCAAHGSHENRAIEAALQRLNQFRQAIENAFCCGASTDVLLIGVDTDTDAIKVHVPDSKGELSAYRYVDNAKVYQDSLDLSPDQARLAVYRVIREASRMSGWAQGLGEPHDGMRRFVANLLINNLSQIEYVGELYGGRYPDIGHAERYISVGDSFEELQVRNIAYYAHLHTLEEGVADIDVGIAVFKGLNVKQGLPIPVAVHYRYDARVPGSRERMVAKAQRVRDAIQTRYLDLQVQGLLAFHLSVQDLPIGSPIEDVSTS